MEVGLKDLTNPYDSLRYSLGPEQEGSSKYPEREGTRRMRDFPHFGHTNT